MFNIMPELGLLSVITPPRHGLDYAHRANRYNSTKQQARYARQTELRQIGNAECTPHDLLVLDYGRDSISTCYDVERRREMYKEDRA